MPAYKWHQLLNVFNSSNDKTSVSYAKALGMLFLSYMFIATVCRINQK